MKKSIGTIILLWALFFPLLSSATDVGGIINTNTTWGLNGSPYNITSEVQIANGVTLTIQPGVVINGFGSIGVWGILNAIGTPSLKISFNDVYIFTGDNALNGVVNIQFAHFITGYFILQGLTGYNNCTLTLLDSKLEDFSVLFIGSTGNSYIERNIFLNSDANTFGAISNNGNVYVRNNLFYQWSGNYAVGLFNFSGVSNAKIIFEYNSLLDTDKIALMDQTGSDVSIPGYIFNPVMIVTNNYWGTTDTSVIDTMIYDRNDDLNLYTYFTYQPFLTQPHPNTPSLFEAPTASFIADNRNGINRLTVNFTDQSTGNVTSRLWNFGDGATSTNQNPSHTYASPGIFTVSLTVNGPGGSDIETKLNYITINESVAMPWIPLLLLKD